MALHSAAMANTTANVATIQCRAGSDAIQGAAIKSTPPPIHATVPACQTSRIRVRSRGGSMVARANTLVSPSTPWISATAIAAMPEHCSKISRIGSSIHYCMVMTRALVPVNTVVYGRRPNDRSTLREGLARPRAQDPGAKRLHGGEGRAAGEGHGGV